MRLALRWLAFLLPAIVLFSYLYRSNGRGLAGESVGIRPLSSPQYENPQHEPQSQSQSEDGATGSEPDTSQSQDPIAAFWQKWVKIMSDARPISKSRLRIVGNAATSPPTNPNKARKPYRNLLRADDSDIERLRQSHAQFVSQLESLKTNGDSELFHGRGIVMVGGGEYFGPAVIGIHMLRRTGCGLPVEVFVPNEDEYEAEICEGYLAKLNAKCVVLARFQAPTTNGDSEALEIKHYQLKAASLLLSSFSEVLLLDSDSIPLVDPSTDIFDAEPYLSHRLITWPDFWGATESPQFWHIAGQSHFPDNLPPASSESGQLVVDKGTHLASLLLATYYNMFGPDYYYPLLSQGALGQGDKETFMAAAVALDEKYYRVKTLPKAIGRYDGEQQKGTAIVQYLPLDDMIQSQASPGGTIRPAFLHSNTPKMNAGHLVDEGDLIAVDGKSRLRLLGPKADLEKLFGFDVEDTVWDLLVQTGCELADSIREWKEREKLCDRLTEHHQLVFDEAL
ncbi:mannosyltransferase putative-domain-containing protein [Dactylonectria macrodidyma]|uniref:Mannosyltransferase putative-domain-containing protein n=1 Tax=Dactylonectria macrodidyma TaxID=307937 RepID=A0A9P9FME2_9HYPO|nr:mannosyltransferase putative-domain-containing protein [Dactylonectria macrodidyma]